MKIEFYKHNIAAEDIKNLHKVLHSLFLTTGKVTESFEKQLAKFLGTKFSVGLMSCSHALELALAYFNVGPGDEVITTPMSYTATADAIEYVGARPVFVDVEDTTGNIDANLVEKAITKKTKAILPVHLFGQMCDMKKIKAVADKHNLRIIEDAAHCLEGERDGVKPGQLSDAACFSFYATKNITCGEGGAVATNNEDMRRWLKKARSHGLNKDVSERYLKQTAGYDKEFLGFKCNMSDIQAALLLGQLKRINKLWRRRAALAKEYAFYFGKIKKIKLFKTLPGVKNAYHLFVIRILGNNREDVAAKLKNKGIGVAITNFPPIHLLSYYREKYGYKPGDYPVAESIGASTITLPLYSKLTGGEVKFIAESVRKVVLK